MTSEFEFILEDTKAKAKSILSEYKPEKIRVAYSGGADSDVMMHFLKQCGFDLTGLFYDTGIEWQATKKHVSEVQLHYNIESIKALSPVPTSNRIHGHPFINKRVTDLLRRLQRHNFDFQNHGHLDFKTLWEMYPKCKAALRWWCNEFGEKSRFNINQNSFLKDFLIEYGLPFKVSNKCCDGAKKNPAKKYIKDNNIDLLVLGIRRAEGSSRIQKCYSKSTSYGYAMYRPILLWSDAMKDWYINTFNIQLSACYTEYGLKRTGCAGCPYGRNFEHELQQLEEHEPKLAKGIHRIFEPTYEWTRKYREYQKKKTAERNGK